VIVRPVLCRPFVGRREELAFLQERRREAASSHGGLVLIAGDAGVGKSRLIAEFCGLLTYSRWTIAQAPCLEFARRPYGPILDILARIEADVSDFAPAQTKQEQFDMIVERIGKIASRKALLIVIEDLHWADAATLELLAYLGPKLERMRAFVLASFRPDELNPEHPATAGVAKIARSSRSGRIDLAPLAGRELQTFIDEALGDIELSDETRRAVAIAGDGNPFFTEELLKSAVERGSTRPAPRHDLPVTVRATLLERLRPFNEDQRRVVTQAAVIGRSFGLELLSTTLGVDRARILPALRRARDFQLVEEVTPDVFRFRHGLTREAIYSDFLSAEAAPLHRTIAVALESGPGGDGSLEALAYHWWAAGDASQTVRYNIMAGDAAGRIHAHADAIAFYERALDSAVDTALRGSIVEKMGDRRLALNWVKEGYTAFGIAADLYRDATDYVREAACRVRAAVIAYLMALSAPTAPLEAMLERLAPEEFSARSALHLGLSWLAASYWFPTKASHHLAMVDERALASSPANRLLFHNVAAWIAMTVGDIEGFKREHATRLAAARAVDSVGAVHSGHLNGAICFWILGLHDEARESIDRALRDARAEHNRIGEIAAHSIAAQCYLYSGDLERARNAVEAVPVTSENLVSIASAVACGTIVAAYLDDKAMIEKWFDGFEASMSPDPETSCGAGFAEIMVRRGRTADAAAILHRTIPECEMIRGNMTTLLAASRYGALADRARARAQLAHAAEGTELVERYGLDLFDAIACRREQREREATALARSAAEGFRRLRFPLFEAEAREIAGETEAALALYRRCGATFDVRRLEIERPAIVPLTAGAGLLSTREREVAALAARGLSNLDIAGKLSITHKTVEKHLASVYQKLNISSRMGLAPYVTSERSEASG
jgi:DNA-binding CsgD family transcriptional regulator/tetratricopeptide (TPR) repeat protein